MENVMSRVWASEIRPERLVALPLVIAFFFFYIRPEINFMQIILTKSNNIKFEKQIGHLVLFAFFHLLLLVALAVRRSGMVTQQTFMVHRD